MPRSLGKAQADAGSDRRIEVCTLAIESGSLSQEKLAVALNSRGAAYARRNDPDRAIADFDAALRLYPDFLAALLDRGMAYGTKGDYERSVADFSAVILRNPKLTQAYNGRCYTLALMGDAAHALDDCNRALALEPNTPYILDSRAYAFLRAGDFPRALADYDLILQIEPKNAAALYGRGIARLRLGRRQDGGRIWSRPAPPTPASTRKCRRSGSRPSRNQRRRALPNGYGSVSQSPCHAAAPDTMLGERTSSPSITHWLMPSAPSRPMLIPLIVACGLFMENLDSTVLSTALPAIARSLEENPLHLSLAMTAYLFSLAVFIPISGWVADRFGRTVFRAAIGSSPSAQSSAASATHCRSSCWRASSRASAAP